MWFFCNVDGWAQQKEINIVKQCALCLHASNPKIEGTASFISRPVIREKANINADSCNSYDYKCFPPTSAWAGRGHKSVQQVAKFQGYI